VTAGPCSSAVPQSWFEFREPVPLPFSGGQADYRDLGALLTPRMMNVFHIPYGGIKKESSKMLFQLIGMDLKTNIFLCRK
jgi:hypothetical protein